MLGVKGPGVLPAPDYPLVSFVFYFVCGCGPALLPKQNSQLQPAVPAPKGSSQLSLLIDTRSQKTVPSPEYPSCSSQADLGNSALIAHSLMVWGGARVYKLGEGGCL